MTAPSGGTTTDAPAREKWLIYSNHHQTWWGPNGSGYRAHIADAGRYEQADTAKWLNRICGCCAVPEIAVPAPPLSVLADPDALAKYAVNARRGRDAEGEARWPDQHVGSEGPAVTDFKPGDKVRVLAWVDQAENGVEVLSFPRNPHHPDGPGIAADVRLSDLIAEHIELEPAPYTEPREGDEVEVDQKPMRGIVKTDPGRAWLTWPDDATCRIAYGDFAKAMSEGRVRLVKAAAPTYEPGTYSSASTGRWVLYPQPPEMLGQPWLHIDARPAESMWHASDTIPADLRPCDLVPREAT